MVPGRSALKQALSLLRSEVGEMASNGSGRSMSGFRNRRTEAPPTLLELSPELRWKCRGVLRTPTRQSLSMAYIRAHLVRPGSIHPDYLKIETLPVVRPRQDSCSGPWLLPWSPEYGSVWNFLVVQGPEPRRGDVK